MSTAPTDVDGPRSAAEQALAMEEICLLLLRLLSPRDRASVARVNRAFRAASLRPLLWTEIRVVDGDSVDSEGNAVDPGGITGLDARRLQSLVARRPISRLQLLNHSLPINLAHEQSEGIPKGLFSDTEIAAALTALDTSRLTELRLLRTVAGPEVTRLIREGAFPNLKHLDVRGSVYIPTLLPITPSLEVFRTGWVKEVSEDMLPVFKLGFDSIWNIRRAVPPCPLLHTLEFHSLYPQALEQVVGLLAPCTRMRDLTMTYCKAKNTDHLGSIVEQCPGLTSLNLRASALQHGVLTTIAHTCHELTSLNIGCVKPVTDGEFAQILEGCPKITALDLCYCQGLSKEMLIRATQVLDLTELGMSGFKEVTDTDVQSIVQACSRLVSLGIGGCEFVTDATLGIISEGLPHLERTTLHNLPLLTFPQIEAFVTRCKNLHTIHLDGCVALQTFAGDEWKERLTEAAAGATRFSPLKYTLW